MTRRILSVRELRTLLALVSDLPLHLGTVHSFEDLLRDCQKHYNGTPPSVAPLEYEINYDPNLVSPISTPPCLCSTPPCLCSSPPCLCSTPPCLCSTPPCLCSTSPCLCSILSCLCSKPPCLCSTPPCLCSIPPCQHSTPPHLCIALYCTHVHNCERSELSSVVQWPECSQYIYFRPYVRTLSWPECSQYIYFRPYVRTSSCKCSKCFYVYLNIRPMWYSAMQI